VARMKRKQIYIDPNQDRRLRNLSKRRGVTESELIRQGIERVLGERAPLALDHRAWEEEVAFVKAWARKGPVKGGRTWKREDLYDR